jgi:hypothetical protein
MAFDMWIGDNDDPNRESYAICTATKEAWEEEITLNEENDVEDWEYIGGGGVPYDCPIYQGEVAPPWEGE